MNKIIIFIAIFITSSFAFSEAINDVSSKGQETIVTEYDFIALKGATLKNTVSTWSEKNGIETKWNVYQNNSELDWVIEADINIQGNVYNAVSQLLEAYDYPLRWAFYKNNILVVWVGQ